MRVTILGPRAQGLLAEDHVHVDAIRSGTGVCLHNGAGFGPIPRCVVALPCCMARGPTRVVVSCKSESRVEERTD